MHEKTCQSVQSHWPIGMFSPLLALAIVPCTFWKYNCSLRTSAWITDWFCATSVRTRGCRAVSVSPAAGETGFRISALLTRNSRFTPLKALQNSWIAEQLKKYGATRMSFQSRKATSCENRSHISGHCISALQWVPRSIVNVDNWFADLKSVRSLGLLTQIPSKIICF